MGKWCDNQEFTGREGRGPWGHGPWGHHGRPHHGHRGHHHHHRGPWGRMGFGGGFGPGAEIDERWVLTLALETLRDQAGNGYDVVTALEAKLGGLAPTPSVVYPALRLAEDAGFVTATATEGRTVYALTEAGHAEVARQADELEAFWQRTEAARSGQELFGLFADLKGLARGMRGGAFDDAALGRLRDAIAAARKALRDDVAG